MKTLVKSFSAEVIGTFWLVFGGCGSAVLAAGIPGFGIGFAGVALAFGLTVLTMAYALGSISGGHFNPAVTIGLWAAKRFPGRRILPYIIAQLIGAIVAALLLWVIASGMPGYSIAVNGLATNGYDSFSPQNYNLNSGFLTEVILTCGFLVVIIGATSKNVPAGFAPIAIGLALTLIHLISIPITNTSVNPARSTGPALIVGGAALNQLWLFWVAPIAGALIAGFASRLFMSDEKA